MRVHQGLIATHTSTTHLAIVHRRDSIYCQWERLAFVHKLQVSTLQAVRLAILTNIKF